jgi:hypothetical protein
MGHIRKGNRKKVADRNKGYGRAAIRRETKAAKEKRTECTQGSKYPISKAGVNPTAG